MSTPETPNPEEVQKQRELAEQAHGFINWYIGSLPDVPEYLASLHAKFIQRQSNHPIELERTMADTPNETDFDKGDDGYRIRYSTYSLLDSEHTRKPHLIQVKLELEKIHGDFDSHLQLNVITQFMENSDGILLDYDSGHVLLLDLIKEGPVEGTPMELLGIAREEFGIESK